MSEHENCHVEPVEKPFDRSLLLTAQATFLAVSGMGCPRCAMRVRNGLLNLEGVYHADVLLERGVAAVAYNPAQVSPVDLIAAVAGAGNDGRHAYQAQLLSTMPASEAFVLSE